MPFPRLNEGAALAEKFKEFNKRSGLLVVRNLALVSVSIVVGLFAMGWVRW